MGRALAVIFIISFALVIILGAFASTTFDKGFYEKEYEKNGVYEKIGKNLTLAVTANLFNYFHGKEELRFFSPEERSHLADVRSLIRAGYVIYGLALVLVIVSFVLIIKGEKKGEKKVAREKTKAGKIKGKDLGRSARLAKHIAKLIFISSLITIGVVFILGILFLFDFSWAFLAFHQVFFPQGNYFFPDYYPLLVLYPTPFWEDAALHIGLRICITAGIAAALSGVAVALSRRKA
jgi:uncharacterized membrane protein